MKLKTRALGWLLGGAAVVGGAAILLRPSARLTPYDRITGLPTTKRLSYRIAAPGTPPIAGVLQIGFGAARAVVVLDGTPVDPRNLAQAKIVSEHMHEAFRLRRMLLPAGADRVNTDGLSKELYWGPSWLTMIQPQQLRQNDLVQAVNGSPFDEFGRLMPGHFGESDQSLWGQTLGGLMKNPLFQYAVVAAAVASGPTGMAAYAAYNMWQKRGELTPKNAVMVAARSYAVSQCGQACGIAFDMGVGLSQGKSPQQAARETFRNQLSPQGRAAFDAGAKLG